MSKKPTTSAQSAAKAECVALDYFGFPLSVGDTIATPTYMRGFTMYVRRRITAVDPATGALTVEDMKGTPVKNRVLRPNKTFKQHGEPQP
jgi:hypothetical protein